MLLSAGALAAPLITLEGKAEGARSEAESNLRLSVLSWAEQDQVAQMVGAVSQYQQTQDAEAFADILEDLPTQGYLFTAAAAGYSIKYAWKEDSQEADRMVFLVTPGLKTRNPVLWNEQNTDGLPFTLVELRWEGDEAVVKTSLDTPISTENGLLQLDNYEAAPAFAEMADNTPYYYANQS